MPWPEVTRVALREEFVKLANVEGVNRRELCRRFGISAKTGYKWLKRYAREGSSGLLERSRRPRRSPTRTAEQIEQIVIQLRVESRHSWGGRKLARVLVRDRGGPKVAPSTVTNILRRAGMIGTQQAPPSPRWERFQRSVPNELWQMDFKGHFPLLTQDRCHPLTVLDDYSRYSLVLKACGDERADTVRDALTAAFRRYGLPGELLMDNGPPWGASALESTFTALWLWFIRLGIRVIHGRPRHPQTQGKDERFHRSLKFELLRHFNFSSLDHCQREFDRFRERYNLVRPHDSLELDTPASRYRVSPIAFPEILPPIEYPHGFAVRKVQHGGWISYRGHQFRVGKALRGFPVALRPLDRHDPLREVLFGHQPIATIDLNNPDALN